MPIRFYCVSCEKLLGIATRKAGQIVSCPACKTQLRVPVPEDVSSAGADVPTERAPEADDPMVPATPGKVFEESNFDQILKDDPTVRPPTEAPKPASHPAHYQATLPDDYSSQPQALPPVELPEPGDEPVEVADIAGPGRRRSTGRGMLLVLVLVIGALVGGFFLGRAEFLQGWP